MHERIFFVKVESHLITLSSHYDTQQKSRYFWSSPSDGHFSKHSKTGNNTIYVQKFHALKHCIRNRQIWRLVTEVISRPFHCYETKGIATNPVVLQWLWPFWTQKSSECDINKMGVLYLVLKNPPKLNCTVMDSTGCTVSPWRCKNMVLILLYSLRLTN